MSSTNFTVPKGVKKIDCFCVGGGGADNFGGKGSASSIGSICSAEGGWGYSNDSTLKFDGYGGSGGGARGNGYRVTSHDTAAKIASGLLPTSIGMFDSIGKSGSGGSDGSDGFMSYMYYDIDNCVLDIPGGKGQGTTTRYFGELNGTLYAGGGGGVIDTFENSGSVGGAGGGGNGGVGKLELVGRKSNNEIYYWEVDYLESIQTATSGSPNTGGGGGSDSYCGSGGGYTTTKLAQTVTPGSVMSVVVGRGGNGGGVRDGGSGICIIRWSGK